MSAPFQNSSISSQQNEQSKLLRPAETRPAWPPHAADYFDPEFGPPVELHRERPPPMEWDPFFGPPVVKGSACKGWIQDKGVDARRIAVTLPTATAPTLAAVQLMPKTKPEFSPREPSEPQKAQPILSGSFQQQSTNC